MKTWIEILLLFVCEKLDVVVEIWLLFEYEICEVKFVCEICVEFFVGINFRRLQVAVGSKRAITSDGDLLGRRKLDTNFRRPRAKAVGSWWQMALTAARAWMGPTSD